MAELRATQFFHANVSTVNPAKTTAWTVPAGRRIIVRSVAMRNLSLGVTQTLYVLVGGIVVKSQIITPPGSSGDSVEWRPWIVVDEGETLQLTVGTAGSVGVVVSGSNHFI